MSATITNSLCKGVVLTIENGFPKWKISGQKENFDPKNSLDDFIQLVETVFEFTCLYGKYIEIESSDNLVLEDIVILTFNAPLEQKNIKYVHYQLCGCNMGNCSGVTNIKICDKQMYTYGDLMMLLCKPINNPNWYPWDDLSFRLEKISSLPEKLYQDHCRSGVQKNNNQRLIPGTTYLSFKYYG